VSIIRRNDCVYATLGTYNSVWMTGMHPAYQTDVSPDDGHIVARNM
jgi:hypothetical protein